MDNKLISISPREKNQILEFLPNASQVEQLSQLFFCFADPTRLKILSCLALSDMCVGDIAKILELNQTTTSHSLQVLRAGGLVKFKRSGKVLVYSLEKKAVNDIMLTALHCL